MLLGQIPRPRALFCDCEFALLLESRASVPEFETKNLTSLTQILLHQNQQATEERSLE